MEICCRPITHIFKDKMQALMHPTVITGQMDFGSWLFIDADLNKISHCLLKLHCLPLALNLSLKSNLKRC